jgi:hypothetical protein
MFLPIPASPGKFSPPTHRRTNHRTVTTALTHTHTVTHVHTVAKVSFAQGLCLVSTSHSGQRCVTCVFVCVCAQVGGWVGGWVCLASTEIALSAH